MLNPCLPDIIPGGQTGREREEQLPFCAEIEVRGQERQVSLQWGGGAGYQFALRKYPFI